VATSTGDPSEGNAAAREDPDRDGAEPDAAKLDDGLEPAVGWSRANDGPVQPVISAVSKATAGATAN
jgi:hypothetical protein